MVKKWWNNSYVNKRDYLLEEYHNFDLDESDIFLLMMMDYQQQKYQYIDTQKLADALKKDENEVQIQLSKLVSEGWLSIEFKQKKIVYRMDALFDKTPSKAIAKSLFDLFEEQFARPLTASEMKTLGTWSVTYTRDVLEEALRQAIVYKRMNFAYINKILEGIKNDEERN